MEVRYWWIIIIYIRSIESILGDKLHYHRYKTPEGLNVNEFKKVLID